MKQAQSEPRPASLSSEAESEQTAGTAAAAGNRKRPSLSGKIFRGAGIAALCLLFLEGGIHLRSDTTLFLEKKTQDGCLPAEEYVLCDPETGQPVRALRSFQFQSDLVYDGGRQVLKTSRGIAPGSTWQEFLDAYGDVTLYSIYAIPYGPDGREDWDAEGIYLYEPVTVREFDQKYIQSGIIDPDSWRIDAEFRVLSDGVHLYYQPREQEAVMSRYYSSFWNDLVGRPRPRRLVLRFDFVPAADRDREYSGVDTISNDYY